MKKKINRGNPLEELVKGSMDYTMQMIRDAFWKQFPDASGSMWIAEMFSDHVIVSMYGDESGLKPDEYFRVAYTRNGEAITFAARADWEVVELTYQPQSPLPSASPQLGESAQVGGKKSRRQRFDERIEALVQLEEANGEKGRRIKIQGAMTAGIINGNGRRYPAHVIESAVAELRSHLNESAGQGRAVQVLGEAEHPSDKGGRPNLLETVVKWEAVDFDGSRVDVKGSILETSKGKDILTLMEGGVMPGVSLRGYGDGKQIKEGSGKVFEVSELHITGFDLVLEPSFENAAEFSESINQIGEIEMDKLLEQLMELRKTNPELFGSVNEAQLKAMGEAQLKQLEESLRAKLGIGPNADIAKVLEESMEKARKFDESQKESGIKAAIAEATKDLPFGEKMNKVFIESFNGQKFADVEAVKTFAENQRKQFSTMAAAGLLAGIGFEEGKIKVLGTVLERETGTPEFARAAFELAESVRKVEMTDVRDWKKPVSVNEKFTKMVLERFDQLYKRQLIAESKMLEEAETTSDLNLPYSVSRALIEEAFPNLVAAGIFDVGVMNGSPERWFYEVFAGETGYTGSVEDEVVTGGAEEVWYDLDYGRVTPGSVVVTSNPAGTTYVENTDYVIDYGGGRIKFLTAGSINTNDVLVDYDYTGVRKGEMAPIERGKITMSYIDVAAKADRLADQISREAIVFSRSQMGLDVVARTMASLVRQLRRKIDQGLIYSALAAVRSVASNSGGAWTTGTTQDDYDELVRLIGATKLKVVNRYYEPGFILASATRSEDLSNWAGFKRDGFPNAILNAAGFVGGVKGLPVFMSTEMPDDVIVVGNRQLVMHKIFQPLTIFGPYPTYDVSGGTSKLVAADQYYAEEFNATESPVEEKGAYLTISDGS